MGWDPGVASLPRLSSLKIQPHRFFSGKETLLKSPVTCADICATVHYLGWWGLRFTTVMP